MSSTMFVVICVAAVVAAYFIGNISPAIIIGKAHGIDIRKEGSGNAGTTNVLRVLGKKAAVATLLIDVLKGVVAVLIGSAIAPNVGMMCALAVFCGHIWPVVFGFKGGKGAATGLGAVFAVNVLVGLAVMIVAAVLLLVSRRMSVGSLAAAVFLPAFSLLLEPGFFWTSLAMTVIMIIKHRANIKRLIRGEEPKISFSK